MCHLTLRAPDGIRQWEVDDWTATSVIASLSAEPETYEEFQVALQRYPRQAEQLGAPVRIDDLRTIDVAHAWCLVDLIGRSIVGGGNFQLPDRIAQYSCESDDDDDIPPADAVQGRSSWDRPRKALGCTESIWTCLSHHWHLEKVPAASDRSTASDALHQQQAEPAGWLTLVEQRAEAARQRLQAPRCDTRKVLYGPPLYRYIAEQLQPMTERIATLPADLYDPQRSELVRPIHAQWLMTPRDDLGGRTVRQVLLELRDHIDTDMQSRCIQWTYQHKAPPPLSRESAAYRYAGFGIIEVVLYFDLVRHVMHQALDLLREQPRLPLESLVARLAECGEVWWNSPQEEPPHGSPASYADSERRRLPISDTCEPIDHDCPLCRAAAESSYGPSFLMFDGHHLELEEDFAFSLLDDRDEWQQQQDQWQSIHEEFAARRAVQEQAGSETTQCSSFPTANTLNAAEDAELDSRIWQRSHVAWDNLSEQERLAPGSARLALGFPLAELIENLKPLDPQRALIDPLNRAYDSFRRAQDDATTNASAQELRAQLQQASLVHPVLTTKSADLQSRLDEVLRLQS